MESMDINLFTPLSEVLHLLRLFFTKLVISEFLCTRSVPNFIQVRQNCTDFCDTIVQRHCMEVLCIEFHTNWSRNVWKVLVEIHLVS
jgi:hypothetical protein